MVSQQVITIGPDGSMSGLQVKKGRGVDLRSFGKAEIVRASEIEWDADQQGWKVTIQDAPGMDVMKGVSVTRRMADAAGIDDMFVAMRDQGLVADPASIKDPLIFADYEDGVRFEIAFLDAWRLKGRH